MKTFYRLTLLRLFLAAFFFATTMASVKSQCTCAEPATQMSLHANNIDALITNRGSLFFDGEDAAYNIVSEEGMPASVFAQGLWMGAIDMEANFRIAAQSYGLANGEYDYHPGPIHSSNTEVDFCDNWNRIWSVTKSQIESHVSDFMDNGILDNPIPAIMSWPSLSNPFFHTYMGFELPSDIEALAPFFDQNQDGIYDPSHGDYPTVPSSPNKIPSQITWTVFNDFGEHTSSHTTVPLEFEVQLTSWAFECVDNEDLNNTTFHSYKIINRSDTAFDSLYLGLFNDFDLGCFWDDYIGTSPEQNTFYTYNQSNTDMETCSGIEGFGMNPPVQAVTFLNRELSKHIYYQNGAFSSIPATTDPQVLTEYYHYLSGKFRDGTPITTGGSGYNPGSSDIVDHIFPGNPNNPDEWSAFSENISIGDRRSISSTFIEHIEPGQIVSLDVAYSYHRAANASNIENVETMYAGVANIQASYDVNFANACTSPLACIEDCVWPGDLNADGIANHCDLLALGQHFGSTGETRLPPFNWTPRSATQWTGEQLDGANNKHLDANGNGEADEDDFEISINHYGNTHSDHQAIDVYMAGPELNLSLGLGPNSDEWTDLEAGDSKVGSLRLTEDIPGLVGLAFSIEYDPAFFVRLQQAGADYNHTASELSFTYAEDYSGQEDFANYNYTATGSLGSGIISIMQIQVNPELPTSAPANSSLIRFKNIKALLADGTEIEIGGETVVAHFPSVLVNTNEPLWGEHLDISPNPFTDITRINLPSTEVQLNLMDAVGTMLFQTEIKNLNYELNFNQLKLPNGVYFLQFIKENEMIYRRVVKQ